MGGMSKKLGELWKKVSSEEKDKYKVRHAYAHAPVVPDLLAQKTDGRVWLEHQSTKALSCSKNMHFKFLCRMQVACHSH